VGQDVPDEHPRLLLLRARALRHLSRAGVIINTGSETGDLGSKTLLDYSATKGAIHAFTKALAQNLVERRSA
jgi:NAD(P)-dependent dehydrogenase (short-subunit alcohol dehydrogenase family)